MSFNALKLKAEKISVVGLGHLGSSLIACLAQKGFEVTGLDSDKHKVNLLKKGLAPVLEPGLDQMIADNRFLIKATKSYHNLISSNQITFVAIPTILGSNKVFSNDVLITVIKKIAYEIKQKDDYHVVIILSTLEPGTMDNVILPLLEHESWKINGCGFGLCYSPVFGELGDIIQSVKNPESIIVGDSFGIITKVLTDIFNKICDNPPPIQQMSYINSELVKIVKDNWIISQISFTNFISELCDKIPNADIDIINKSMYDSKKLFRILGYGGPYLAQSFEIFKKYLNKLNLSPNLSETTTLIQHHQTLRLIDLILATLPEGGKVGILGLSYWPGTDNIQHSQSITLIEWLLKQDIDINVFDFMAIPNTREIFQNKIYYSGSISECLSSSNVVVIATPCNEFNDISITDLKERDDKLTIIDCWNIFDKEKYQEFVNYILPGSEKSYTKTSKVEHNYDYNLIDLLEVSKIFIN